MASVVREFQRLVESHVSGAAGLHAFPPVQVTHGGAGHTSIIIRTSSQGEASDRVSAIKAWLKKGGDNEFDRSGNDRKLLHQGWNVGVRPTENGVELLLHPVNLSRTDAEIEQIPERVTTRDHRMISAVARASYAARLLGKATVAQIKRLRREFEF